MGFENFEPIFGEPKAEWANTASRLPTRFLFHVHAPDSSHLIIHATDFHSNTWEAKRSVFQLEDMRDDIGIGGSWSEFIDYLTASLKSEDVKLVLEGCPNSHGVAYAKLVAQKSKGMPRISISLTKLADRAASEAMANLSLQLFKEFKNMQYLLVQGQEHSVQLTNGTPAEKERNESTQSQLDLYSKRQKLQRMNASEKDDVSMSDGLQNSPDKQAARDPIPVLTKVSNRVIPAYRRAKVRGAVLKDTEDADDN